MAESPVWYSVHFEGDRVIGDTSLIAASFSDAAEKFRAAHPGLRSTELTIQRAAPLSAALVSP